MRRKRRKALFTIFLGLLAMLLSAPFPGVDAVTIGIIVLIVIVICGVIYA